MTLLENIKTDHMRSRVISDTKKTTILTTLISECEMVGKNDGNRKPTDEEVLKMIEKFIKNNKEILNLAREDSDIFKSATFENSILITYLPPQLSEEELKNIISELVEELPETSITLMGKIMKQLNISHSGKFDKSLASKLCKELLS